MIIRELSPKGGVEIRGIDMSQPLTTDEASRLRAAFEEHGLVVMRDQSLTKHQMVPATEPFGGPQVAPPANDTDPDVPGVGEISTRGPDGKTILHTDEDEPVGVISWHSDQGYVTHPNRGKLLYAVEVPEEGGMTGFIDGFRTYAALSDVMKAKIAGLHVIQSWAHAQDTVHKNRGYRRDGDKVLADNRFPDTVYPLALRHPNSGRISLNLPPLWASGILEMPGEEGRALLDKLIEHMTRPEFAYWHRYSPGDLLAWDNWRFVHAAGGTPGRCVRTLWSIVIDGGPQLGRLREPGTAEPLPAH